MASDPTGNSSNREAGNNEACSGPSLWTYTRHTSFRYTDQSSAHLRTRIWVYLIRCPANPDFGRRILSVSIFTAGVKHGTRYAWHAVAEPYFRVELSAVAKLATESLGQVGETGTSTQPLSQTSYRIRKIDSAMEQLNSTQDVVPFVNGCESRISIRSLRSRG